MYLRKPNATANHAPTTSTIAAATKAAPVAKKTETQQQNQLQQAAATSKPKTSMTLPVAQQAKSSYRSPIITRSKAAGNPLLLAIIERARESRKITAALRQRKSRLSPLMSLPRMTSTPSSSRNKLNAPFPTDTTVDILKGKKVRTGRKNAKKDGMAPVTPIERSPTFQPTFLGQQSAPATVKLQQQQQQKQPQTELKATAVKTAGTAGTVNNNTVEVPFPKILRIIPNNVPKAAPEQQKQAEVAKKVEPRQQQQQQQAPQIVIANVDVHEQLPAEAGRWSPTPSQKHRRFQQTSGARQDARVTFDEPPSKRLNGNERFESVQQLREQIELLKARLLERENEILRMRMRHEGEINDYADEITELRRQIAERNAELAAFADAAVAASARKKRKTTEEEEARREEEQEEEARQPSTSQKHKKPSTAATTTTTTIINNYACKYKYKNKFYVANMQSSSGRITADRSREPRA